VAAEAQAPFGGSLEAPYSAGVWAAAEVLVVAAASAAAVVASEASAAATLAAAAQVAAGSGLVLSLKSWFLTLGS